MARRTNVIRVGSDRRGEAERKAYGERTGEPGSRVGVTKPTRAQRKRRHRR